MRRGRGCSAACHALGFLQVCEIEQDFGGFQHMSAVDGSGFVALGVGLVILGAVAAGIHPLFQLWETQCAAALVFQRELLGFLSFQLALALFAVQADAGVLFAQLAGRVDWRSR